MSRDPRAFVEDIIEYSGRASRYIDGLTFDEFAADSRTRDAVLFALQIVGEAAKRLPEDVRVELPPVREAAIALLEQLDADGRVS